MPSYQFALEKLTSEPGYFLYQTEYLLVVKTFLEMSSSTPDLGAPTLYGCSSIERTYAFNH